MSTFNSTYHNSHSRPFPGQHHFETDMDRQQREWEREFDKLRDDFFRSKFLPEDSFDTFPSTMRRKVYTTSSPSPGSPVPREVYVRTQDTPPRESRPYRVTFDVYEFAPEDIKVTLENDLLQVEAVHEDARGGGTSRRQYSQSVQIPKYVDPDKLISIYTDDGRLTIEAPLPPSYQQVLFERQTRDSH